MKVLLLYTTNSGSTEMAAQEIVNRLSPSHEVTMKRVNQSTADDIKAVDAVILGSPSWDHDGKEGQPHDEFFVWKGTVDPSAFAGKKMAVYGCGDSSYQIFCGAVDELEKWIAEWNGVKVVDSLRMDKYYYNMAENAGKIEEWCKQLLETLK